MVPVITADSSDALPKLLHRVNHRRSILSLAVSKDYVYAGSQTGEILVRINSMGTFECTILTRSAGLVA